MTNLILELSLIISHLISRVNPKVAPDNFRSTILGPQKMRGLVELLGSAGKGKNAQSRSVATRTILPLLSALAVEVKFAPTLLEAPVLKKVATRIFDALLQTPSR